MIFDFTACQAFFFDFDGVLADSVEVKTKAFAEIFQPFGQNICTRVINHHRENGGMTRSDKFKYYYEKFIKEPLSEKKLNALCKQFSLIVVNSVVNSPEIKGAERFLIRWHKKIPCFIVSATPESELIDIVEQRGLKKYFKGIYGSPISKEDIIQNLIDQHGFLSGNTLFWGDAISDYKAAVLCKVNFLGVLPGNHAPLLKAVPEVTWIKDFLQIKG